MGGVEGGFTSGGCQRGLLATKDCTEATLSDGSSGWLFDRLKSVTWAVWSGSSQEQRQSKAAAWKC